MFGIASTVSRSEFINNLEFVCVQFHNQFNMSCKYNQEQQSIGYFFTDMLLFEKTFKAPAAKSDKRTKNYKRAAKVTF